MPDPPAEAQFQTWSVPECPFAIEYRSGLMHELRAAVAYGQQALTRGGMEVGGVLLGTRSAHGISIVTWRPIGCEHALGPALLLSDRDRTELRNFLSVAAGLPGLAGFKPVGWFLSHARSEIALRESDLRLYAEFFPAPSDVALVLRPGRHGAARAGFFFRDSSGVVHSDSSYLEFNIEGDLGWPNLPAPPYAAQDSGIAPAPEAYAHVPEPQAEAPSEPILTGKQSWRWIALPIAALLAILWLYLARNRSPELAVTPIPMTLIDHGGQLVVQWDHSRPELKAVRSGEISIVDAGTRIRLPLTAAEAQVGSFTFIPKSGDVQVLLRFDGPPKPLSASARFLGPPPAPAAAPLTSIATPPDSPDVIRLRAENDLLRGDLSRARAQADQDETVIRVLRERVAAAESGGK